jgi:hypothetical protein
VAVKRSSSSSLAPGLNPVSTGAMFKRLHMGKWGKRYFRLEVCACARCVHGCVGGARAVHGRCAGGVGRGVCV